jgi:hypothetical protein
MILEPTEREMKVLRLMADGRGDRFRSAGGPGGVAEY